MCSFALPPRLKTTASENLLPGEAAVAELAACAGNAQAPTPGPQGRGGQRKMFAQAERRWRLASYRIADPDTKAELGKGQVEMRSRGRNPRF